jgi:UDP-N-acetylglucosamine--N-acetylmuramyl-(pentapeptide) pyrophosphoryl-undecaprenol N-acetylglucosamine transferase
LLKRLRPDVVVGFGSYHVFPMLAAAAMMRMKIVLYEANCVLGKVNRLFLPFSKVLALQFPLESSLRRSHEYISYFPWVSDAKRYIKAEARCFYGFDDSLPVCLVFGGSQGAAFFNEEAPKVLSGCQVIHCTGKEEVLAKVRLAYEEQQIRAFVQPFERDMGRAYAAADIALCRGGAATIAELIRYHVPAVVVPFPWASNDHQRVNAEFFCKKAKGGMWLAQKESCRLRSEIQRCLLERRELLESLQLFYQKTEKKVELADLVRSI